LPSAHPPRLPHLQLDDGRELAPCRGPDDERTSSTTIGCTASSPSSDSSLANWTERCTLGGPAASTRTGQPARPWRSQTRTFPRWKSAGRMEKLSRESGGRLRVVDAETAYLRLAPRDGTITAG